MAPSKARKRPMLTLTVDADIKRRLQALAGKLPRGTVSGLVEEQLKVTLPLMEQVVEALLEARKADGSLDDEMARERIAAWIGMQMLKLYDPVMLGEGAKQIKP